MARCARGGRSPPERHAAQLRWSPSVELPQK